MLLGYWPNERMIPELKVIASGIGIGLVSLRNCASLPEGCIGIFHASDGMQSVGGFDQDFPRISLYGDNKKAHQRAFSQMVPYRLLSIRRALIRLPSMALKYYTLQAMKASDIRSRRLILALGHQLTATRPPHSVAQLAARTDCDRRTLWYHWSKTFAQPMGMHLQTFVDWTILLGATHERAAGLRWADVAARLDVRYSQLRRTAIRLTDLRIPQLVEDHAVWARTEYARQVLLKIPRPRITEA